MEYEKIKGINFNPKSNVKFEDMINVDKMVIINQKRLADNYVRIEVCDHGIGIDEDQLKDIWERYYKASNQHRRAINGTGLGLYIGPQGAGTRANRILHCCHDAWHESLPG